MSSAVASGALLIPDTLVKLTEMRFVEEIGVITTVIGFWSLGFLRGWNAAMAAGGFGLVYSR